MKKREICSDPISADPSCPFPNTVVVAVAVRADDEEVGDYGARGLQVIIIILMLPLLLLLLPLLLLLIVVALLLLIIMIIIMILLLLLLLIIINMLITIIKRGSRPPGRRSAPPTSAARCSASRPFRSLFLAMSAFLLLFVSCFFVIMSCLCVL